MSSSLDRYFWCLLALIGLSLFFQTYYPIVSDDLWTYLRVGQWMDHMHRIPPTIMFAIPAVADQAYVAHSWLANALFYYLLPTSAVAMVWARVVLFACLGLGVYAASRRICQDRLLCLALAALVCFTTALRPFVRPELLAVLLSVAQVTCLYALTKGPRIKWAVLAVLVQLIWANMHGSFLLGWCLPPLVALYAMERQKSFQHGWFWLALSIAVVLVSLINPYGIGLWVHSWQLAHAPFIREDIIEWRGLWMTALSSPWAMQRIVVFMLYSVLWFALRAYWRPSLWLFYLLAAYMVCDAHRHFAFFGVLLLVPLWHVVEHHMHLWQRHRETLVCCIFIWFAFLAHLAPAKCQDPFSCLPEVSRHARFYNLSESAQAFIKAHVRGAVYNSQVIGGQLLYAFYPQIRVGIDGRVDAYGASYFKQYNQLLGHDAKHIADFLHQHDMHTMLLIQDDVQLWRTYPSYHALVEHGPWRIVFSDQWLVILSDQ